MVHGGEFLIKYTQKVVENNTLNSRIFFFRGGGGCAKLVSRGGVGYKKIRYFVSRSFCGTPPIRKKLRITVVTLEILPVLKGRV